MSEVSLLILALFIVINFLILFVIKKRNSLMMAIIFSSLTAILFLSHLIETAEIFLNQSVIILLISVSSIFVSFKKDSSKEEDNLDDLDQKNNKNFLLKKIKNYSFISAIFLVSLLLGSLIFYSTESLKLIPEHFTNSKNNNKIIAQNITDSSHASHRAIKKYYMKEASVKNQKILNKKDEKIEKQNSEFKEKISKNPLLKNSLEITLLLIFLIIISSISNYKKENDL